MGIIGAGLYPTVIVPLQIAYGGRERPVRVGKRLHPLGSAALPCARLRGAGACALPCPILTGPQPHPLPIVAVRYQARDQSLSPGFSKKGANMDLHPPSRC